MEIRYVEVLQHLQKHVMNVMAMVTVEVRNTVIREEHRTPVRPISVTRVRYQPMLQHVVVHQIRTQTIKPIQTMNHVRVH